MYYFPHLSLNPVCSLWSTFIHSTIYHKPDAAVSSGTTTVNVTEKIPAHTKLTFWDRQINIQYIKTSADAMEKQKEGEGNRVQGRSVVYNLKHGDQCKPHWESSVWPNPKKAGSEPCRCLTESTPGTGTSEHKKPEVGICAYHLLSMSAVSGYFLNAR